MNIKKSLATIISGLLFIGNLTYMPQCNKLGSLTNSFAEETENISIWDGNVETTWYNEEESEFHLKSAKELAGLKDLVNNYDINFNNKKIYLDVDIDLDGRIWTPIGVLTTINRTTDMRYFEGLFDGNGHSIYNLNCLSSKYSGLFGHSKGSIKNVNIVDCKIKGLVSNYDTLGYAGGICGYSEGDLNSRITNCSVSGDISISANSRSSFNSFELYVGGICGYSNNIINNCQNSAAVGIVQGKTDIYLSGFCGGIVGYTKSNIYKCENKGIISLDGNNANTGIKYIGGISGKSNGIAGCINEGDVYAQSNQSSSLICVGGITSLDTDNTIKECSNSGNISAIGDYIQTSIAGISSTGRCYECSNFGNISLELLNSLSPKKNSVVAGISCNGNVENCYNWGDIKGYNAFTLSPNMKILRSDCYNIGKVNNNEEVYISEIIKPKIDDEEYANSLGEKYIYVENDYPALKWEIENNLSRQKNTDQKLTTTTTKPTTTTTKKTTTTTKKTTTTTKRTTTTTKKITTTVKVTTTTQPISIGKTEITMKNGEQYAIPANRTDLTYKSNNNDIAIVSSKGIITAVGTGNAIISVIDSEWNVVQINVTVTTSAKQGLPGDSNMDNQVDLSDVVLIMQALANPNKYGLIGSDKSHLTEQGAANADVEGGNGITANDALTIQQYLLKIIAKLPV